jgi:transcriptional regulator with XRE-family HTH domain
MNKRIYDLMKQKGVTQGWLAARLGISQANLSQKLSDQRRLTLKEAKRIALALDVSLDYITGVSNDPDPKKGKVKFHAVWRSEVDKDADPILLVNEIQGGSTVVFDPARHEWESNIEEKKAEKSLKEDFKDYIEKINFPK